MRSSILRSRIIRGHAERGQAVVEAALGAMLFVTIILFGIHFAEVGYLSLKTTEAANFAAFDMPFRAPEHNAAANTWGHTAVVGTESTRATNRYRDYDGRSSHPGSAAEDLAVTRADPMDVKCSSAGGGFRGLDPEMNSLGTSGNTAGSCNAEAVVRPYGIASNYFQNSHGFFHTKQRNYTAIHVCGIGRWNGGCSQGIPIMLDHWGLVGDAESRECALGGCANTAFHDTVGRVFKNNSPQNTPGEAMAAVVGAPAPMSASENTFWMSFRGEESGFMEPLPGGSHYPDGSNNQWNTTPFTCEKGGKNDCSAYQRAHGKRTGCFLGIDCGAF